MILSNQNHWSRIKISFCPSFVIQCFFNVVHSYKMNTGCTASSVYKYISFCINHSLSFLSIFYLDTLSLLLFTVHYCLILLDFFFNLWIFDELGNYIPFQPVFRIPCSLPSQFLLSLNFKRASKYIFLFLIETICNQTIITAKRKRNLEKMIWYISFYISSHIIIESHIYN